MNSAATSGDNAPDEQEFEGHGGIRLVADRA